MSGDILGIGTSALLSYQQALATTGHNIANVGREGYSRQRVHFATMPPQSLGSAGYVGSGVRISGVERIYDAFVQRQMQSSTSTYEQQAAYYGYAARVDDLLADPNIGLAPGLQQFFAAVQEVSSDPTSTAARQVMISEAETLANRFGFLQQWLGEQRAILNGQIGSNIVEINALSDSIADINMRIVEVTGRAGGAPPNDLLDQRDNLVLQLSEIVSITTLMQDDGAMNVFIGSGQNLVLGNQVTRLSATPLGADPTQNDVGLVLQSGGVLDVSHLIDGGRLGGLLAVRTGVLDVTQNMLGRIAVGLAETFNAQHMLGEDLNGNPGVEFFNSPQPEILYRQGDLVATGLPGVTIDDVGGLTQYDYELRFDGTDWVLRSLPNRQVAGTVAPGGTLTAHGLEIDMSGVSGEATNDYFVIRPTRNAAAGISVAIDDPRLVAASGGGGPGDNSNALALAALREARLLSGGTATFGGSYSSLIAHVGVNTRTAEVTMKAQERMLADVRAQRESISGVNLDEEAANLMRFQQAYQASAQVIATANRLFDELLAAVRR